MTLIVVVPVATPYTLTWVVDCVCPAAIVILAGDTVALVGSLLVSSRNKRDCAALPKLIGKGTDSPGDTDTLAGTIMSTAVLTVTFAVASVRFGALARITAEPAATPETGIVAVVAPGCIVAAGEPTVATLVLLELTLKVRPPEGAGPESVNVRFWVSVPESVRLGGEKLIVAVTWTALVVEVYTGALAVMFVVPGSFPITSGGATAGCVWPVSMVTLAGIMPTFGVSLDNVTVTPPWGAGAGRVTWNATVCPSPTVTFDGRPIAPALCTVMLHVAFETLGVLEAAVIVVAPALAPFSVTVAVVACCAMVTVCGMVTTPAELALRLTETTDGAGADNVSVIFSVSGPIIV